MGPMMPRLSTTVASNIRVLSPSSFLSSRNMSPFFSILLFPLLLVPNPISLSLLLTLLLCLLHQLPTYELEGACPGTQEIEGSAAQGQALASLQKADQTPNFLGSSTDSLGEERMDPSTRGRRHTLETMAIGGKVLLGRPKLLIEGRSPLSLVDFHRVELLIEGSSQRRRNCGRGRGLS